MAKIDWTFPAEGFQTAKWFRVSLNIACVLVLAGILTAGLWPFHAPHNQVSWLSREQGILLGEYGSLVSASPFMRRKVAAGPTTVEVVLQPARISESGTILAFSAQGGSSIGFAIRQSHEDLLLATSVREHKAGAKIYVDDVFGKRGPMFIAIVASQSGTRVYVNGALAKTTESFTIARQDLAGKLIIGNSPNTTDNWSGQVRGLALYDDELSNAEISDQYQEWVRTKQFVARPGGGIAVYPFNEARGDIAHNATDASTNLLIPQRFFVLHPAFLETPWDEFRPEWSYLKYIAINVAGFMPFGFCFSAYFLICRKLKHPLAAAVACGFLVSLTIELTQAFLPTRDSGMTDIITNTLGTAIGGQVFLSSVRRSVLSRLVIDEKSAFSRDLNSANLVEAGLSD